MALPNLPVRGQDPWFDDRNNWDVAVAARLDELSVQNDRFAQYDIADTATTLPDATSVFIQAATQAKAQGKQVIRVAPGQYTVPGIHPDDILRLYVVGDGVKLVGNPVPNVYPFSTHEWASLAARATTGVTGRGVVAFEVDDALDIHWTRLFPLCKELGITMGTAWHTDNGARWITEAHRHGWEVISHMPYDADWTSKTLAEVEAAAASSLDAIEDAIGTREGIGFVYPRHLRTPAMDSVLAKYYTRGRGVAGVMPYSRGAGHPWMVTAYSADPQLPGLVSETLKALLRSVSAQDGQIVLYIHFDSVTADAREAGLRELIPFIRSLGMDIRNPGQVWGSTNVIPDPYDERASWTLGGGATRTSTDSFKGGTAVEFGTTNGTCAVGVGQLAPRSGMFTVMRLSARVKTSGFTVSAGWGLSCSIVEQRRSLAGGMVFPASVAMSGMLPASGTSQGALDWGAVRRLLYLTPATVGVAVSMNSANVTSGSYLMDEVKLDLVDYVPSVEYTAALNGTTDVNINTGVPGLGRCGVLLQPLGPIAGRLSFTVSGSVVRVRSSDATDTAVQVKVIITPGAPYDSMVPPTDGA